MGIVLWLLCGLAAFVTARLVPRGRSPGWLAELLISVTAALLLGVVATALDFGGWRELDWRAGAFVPLGAFAAVGIVRAFRIPSARSRSGPPRPLG